MSTDAVTVRPGRTAVAALVGGVIGGPLFFFGAAPVFSLVGLDDHYTGLGALLVGLVVGAAGAFIGAAVTLVVAFRDEPRRSRAVTAVVTLVLGPAMLATLQAVGDPGAGILWLVLSVLVSAFAGRWLAAARS